MLFKKAWVIAMAHSITLPAVWGSFALALVALIVLLIKKGWGFKEFFRRRDAFQMKVATILCAFVVIPCGLIALSSIFFLKGGLEVWFHERVRTALEESREVAQAYLHEHTKGLKHTIRAMAKNLELYFSEIKYEFIFSRQDQKFIQYTLNDPVVFILNFQKELSDYLSRYEVAFRSFKAGIFNTEPFFGVEKVQLLAFSPFSLSLGFKLFSRLQLQDVYEKGIEMILSPQKDEVIALTPIFKNIFNRPERFYLIVSCPLDENVIEKIKLTHEAVDAYHDLLGLQNKLIRGFTIFFLFMTLFFIILAIGLGMHFARLILNPVSALLEAARKLSEGERIKICNKNMPSAQELKPLINTFNAMSQEVYEKKKELELANNNLQTRTIFVQSVLSGISSGVLRLRRTGEILLANPQAQVLLGQSVEGVLLSEILPEFMPLLEQAFIEEKGSIMQDITLLRKGKPATFRVSVKTLAPQEDAVLTWDDVSELISAQKKNAWTDVARRIAHEVKNPLTPILLSAERLRRRYLSSVPHPEIFQDCIDTIQSQVRHIGDLINEFLTFARMPNPVLSGLDMTLLVQRHICFQQEAYPEILFSLKSQGRAMVLGDGRQIEQVLINLFKNAIEAIQEVFPDGQKGGAIDVHLFKQGADIVMTLCDNGVGLSTDKTLLLCEPYMTTKAEGTGLGLAIVQKIIYAHQGQFSLVPNEKNQGVCATIHLKALAYDLRKI